jgi:hypothetical protein
MLIIYNGELKYGALVYVFWEAKVFELVIEICIVGSEFANVHLIINRSKERLA